jgi:hypothetical protein
MQNVSLCSFKKLGDIEDIVGDKPMLEPTRSVIPHDMTELSRIETSIVLINICI